MADVAPRPPPAAGPMIRLDGVSKSFDGGRSYAVREARLEVARGGFQAIVGESGSGKSTLLRTLNRLIEPDAGTVEVDGRPVDASPAFELRRRIGYVFQGSGLFPHMSVAENIAITPRLLGWPRAKAAERVATLLDLVRLPRAFGERAPAALSGGQRQRVALARALAAEPSIVLLDEPFGALDALIRDELGREYRRLHDELGLTTVMITHDMLEAVLLADRIAAMRGGAIVAEGEPRELAAEGADPYARTLMDAPRRQAAVVAERMAIPSGGG